MNKDVNEGGVLFLSEFEKAKIASSKVSNDGRMSDAQKFRAILAYQFELGYDLAIALSDNASQSPGFESFFGTWRNHRRVDNMCCFRQNKILAALPLLP